MLEKDLSDIANVLRRDALEMTTAAESGHPTSCLSAAEIISVLFFSEMRFDVKNAFNPDNDEFILSKGHAAPILYSALFHAGCIKENLKTLRRLESNLEGHPVPHKMPWIKVATGSLGQGLSVGVGMALAAKLQRRNYHTYVLVGDSEMTEGSNFEALQIGAYYKLNNLCAIIDVNRLGQRGETMYGWHLEKYKKIFSSAGWKTLICDGHDVSSLIRDFKLAKKSKFPTVIIAKTVKGRGVSFLEDKEDWHGKALNNEQLKKALKEIGEARLPIIEIKKPSKTPSLKIKVKKIRLNKHKTGEKISTREAYGCALAKVAENDSRVIVVDAEVSNSTKTDRIKILYPKQFIEGFIAEQNMVGMCLGLSKKGFNVFGSTFAAFLTRAHDQIRMASISDGNFVLCGSHAGVSIGEDGASQMGMEDIAMFRALPKSFVFYPSDAVSTEKIVALAKKINGLKYIRTTRGETPIVYKDEEVFEVGGFKILKNSRMDKVVLIGAGVTLHECLKAHEKLRERGINSAVIDLYCIKPLNEKKLIHFVEKHGKKVVVSEDHYREGGIGEMISEVLENRDIKIRHLFVKEVPHSGKPWELLRKYAIDSESIVKAALS